MKPALENTANPSARAVCYLRVSTDDQANGIDAQRDAIASHCERLGLALVGPYVDEGISGGASVEDRPALLSALSDLGPGDVLLVSKRDRLGRDPMIVAMIEMTATRKGARVVSVAGEGTGDDDPTSILMRRIIDAFAEFERLQIRTRTRAALASLRKRGRVSGVVPYGRKAVVDGSGTKSSGGVNAGKLEDSAEELAMIARVADLRARPATLAEVAAVLNLERIPTRKGGLWTRQTVAHVLKSRAGQLAEIKAQLAEASGQIAAALEPIGGTDA